MKKADTAAKILDAALREIVRNGYAAASTNTICQTAGVAKGTIFKHFGYKAGLYAAVFDRELDLMLAELEAFETVPGRDVFDTLIDVIAWKVRYAAMHADATKFLFGAFAEPPPVIATRIAARFHDLERMSIRRFFRDLPWERFRPELKPEDVFRILETAASGLQATYARVGMDLKYMESIREQSIEFMKIVVKGMEKTDEKSI